MAFTQRRNRLTTRFSERIPVVKRRRDCISHLQYVEFVNYCSLLMWGYKVDTVSGRNVPTFLRSCSRYWYRV